jgi:hypothetical protein
VTTGQLIVVGVAVLLAALTQAVAGFGFGLLAVPVMTLAIDPKVAVVVSTLVGASVTIWQAVHLHADGDPAVVKRMVIPAYVGMPLGIAVFELVSDDTLQRALGVTVLVAVVILVAPVTVPVSRALDVGAGFVSGVLNTSLSTNGPPLVFALHSRKMTAVAFRGTIVPVFAWCNIGGLALFAGRGQVTRDGLLAAAVALPAMLTGQLFGQPLRSRVNERLFRRLVLALLTFAAASAIMASL